MSRSPGPPRSVTRSKGPKALPSSEYRSYIRSAAWRARRKTLRAAHPKECYCCEAPAPENSVGFHVHHVTYRRLGIERPEDVVIVCIACHEAIHEQHREQRKRGLRHATDTVRKRHGGARPEKSAGSERKKKRKRKRHETPPPIARAGRPTETRDVTDAEGRTVARVKMPRRRSLSQGEAWAARTQPKRKKKHGRAGLGLVERSGATPRSDTRETVRASWE